MCVKAVIAGSRPSPRARSIDSFPRHSYRQIIMVSWLELLERPARVSSAENTRRRKSLRRGRRWRELLADRSRGMPFSSSSQVKMRVRPILCSQAAHIDSRARTRVCIGIRPMQVVNTWSEARVGNG